MYWTRPRYSIALSLQTHFASSVSGDSSSRSSCAHSAAPWVRKLGYLCIQEILVLTKSCAARTIIFQRENLNYLIVCFTSSMYPVFPKSLFSIADLFAVRYLWVVFNEEKENAVLWHSARNIRVARLVYVRTYCVSNKQLSISGGQYSIQYRNYSSLHIRIRESHVNQHNRS